MRHSTFPKCPLHLHRPGEFQRWDEQWRRQWLRPLVWRRSRTGFWGREISTTIPVWELTRARLWCPKPRHPFPSFLWRSLHPPLPYPQHHLLFHFPPRLLCKSTSRKKTETTCQKLKFKLLFLLHFIYLSFLFLTKLFSSLPTISF